MTAPPQSPELATDAVVELAGVSKSFSVSGAILRRQVHAVTDVSLSVYPGETLGLVGESGSGKSTLGRLALGLIEPTSGSVRLHGTELTGQSPRKIRHVRRHSQMVFQDPYSAFDPLLPVGTSIAEPIDVHLDLDRAARTERLEELVAQVGLAPEHLQRFPRELSGGQLQRLAIARALAPRPSLIVLDEPVSSLDVSTQAQVINLLEALQHEVAVSFLFIAHNPALVHHASDRIAVMYLGEIVEIGEASTIYERPRHPYTQALLSAATVPDPDSRHLRQRIVLEGDIPDPTEPPSGCRFHTRCPVAMPRCSTDVPVTVTTDEGSVVRCHLVTGGSTAEADPSATERTTQTTNDDSRTARAHQKENP